MKSNSKSGLQFHPKSHLNTTLRKVSGFQLCRYVLPAAVFVVLFVLCLNILGKMKGCSEAPLEGIAPGWFLEDQKLEQDDPLLLKYIAKYHLQPPSDRPYHSIIDDLADPSPLGPVIQSIFKGQRHGFFVEAGAFNGIQESNSLVLERDFKWNGLLVEGNSFILTELRLAYRKAWIADVGLALASHPQKVKFTHHPGETSAAMIKYSEVGTNPSNDNMEKYNEERKDKFISAGYVECFPVFSLLSAMNVTKVDYFSLDVEGAELKVLENIPFDRVDIRVFSVEHWIVDGGIPALDAFFIGKKYTRIAKKGSDVFYAQNRYLIEYEFDKKTVEGVE